MLSHLSLKESIKKIIEASLKLAFFFESLVV